MLKKVLIVEDNTLNMMLMHDITITLADEVIQTDGVDINIIDLIIKEQPDLILMDIQLPGLLSGLDWIKKIRANAKFDNIYIIAVTAYALVGDKERIINAGADQYIDKPIKVLNLIELINTVLEKNNALG